MALNDQAITKRISALAHKAAQLPQTPGVYLMKDGRGSVVYVGKAKSLRTRVRSYFRAVHSHPQKTQLLLSCISDVETIATPTEKDALILENDLIKRYRPRFNVVFRDDKEYPYLRLSVHETYPTLTIVRRPRRDGARYFGPFPSAQSVRETLKAMQRLFPMRTCTNHRLLQRRPCLYYQLGRCPAPCARQIDPVEYRQTVRSAELFLQGRNTQIIRELKQRMEEAARALNFEQAALLRDRIAAIEATLQKQALVCRDLRDRDIFAACRIGDHYVVTILFIRASRVMGSRNFVLKQIPVSDQEALGSFIVQYYDQENYIPEEIIVSVRFESMQAISQWLRDKKGGAVSIVCPQRGFRKTLVDMAVENVKLFAQQQHEAAHRHTESLEELRIRLHLPVVPQRIACVDISTIGSTAAVGAVVVFQNAEPETCSYRRFRITSVHRADDYAMIQEVLTRFLSRARAEQKLPDLMIADGGKGQLAILAAVLRELGITSVSAAAIAKGRSRRSPGARPVDHVFVPGRKNHIPFPRHSAALLLLQRIRDEAHRFAVAYHTTLRTRTGLRSQLEDIHGIGPKTAQSLLQHFGKVETIAQATLDQLMQVPGMTQRKAAAILNAFKSPDKGTEDIESSHPCVCSDQTVE